MTRSWGWGHLNISTLHCHHCKYNHSYSWTLDRVMTGTSVMHRVVMTSLEPGSRAQHLHLQPTASPGHEYLYSVQCSEAT